MTSFALNARGAGLILAACVITTFPSHTLAQGTNPLIRVWKGDLAKSTFSPGPPPRSLETRTYTQNGDGLTFVRSGGVNADGSASPTQSFAAHFDGKDYPMTGSSNADMVTITMSDASTLVAITKLGGNVRTTTRFTVSKDGKTMTRLQTGPNEAGLLMRNMMVYSKQ